jgi:UDP-glucose 4-epimerase
MKNYIVVTGGAGFVGSNLIKNLLNNTKKKIICLDNYSSGSIKNHIKNKRVNYIKGNTINISEKLKKFDNKIHSLFHFGEFSRIYQSFKKFDKCLDSNTHGSNQVFKFCLNNKIKLIYSATSASFGKNKNNKNLSPYAFSKAKNLEFLENLKKWFNFKYEIIYFYNVYGSGQIKKGSMATVIGIFEDQYVKKKPLTVVKPGNQTRRFTHIDDTIDVCYQAWKNNKCAHYSISNLKSYSILEVARMFKSRIKMLKSREGERYASSLTKFSLNNRIIRKYGKIDLKDYITSFIKD